METRILEGGTEFILRSLQKSVEWTGKAVPVHPKLLDFVVRM
jgi:hypothetical protein